jgi:hypothetical protein
MKDDEIIEIDGLNYRYCAYYKRLQLCGHEQEKNPEHPAIVCPECKNTLFRITYGDYECIANCKCGHIMVVYDG